MLKKKQKIASWDWGPIISSNKP